MCHCLCLDICRGEIETEGETDGVVLPALNWSVMFGEVITGV